MAGQPEVTPWTDEDRASWRTCCTLESMRGWWAGSDCVVVGGGPSAAVSRLRHEEFSGSYWTIGCNRAATFAYTDFAACFEPRKDRDVWEVAKASSATFLLSHIPRDHPRTILTGPKMDVVSWIDRSTPRIDRHPTEKGQMWLGQSTFCALAAVLVLGFEIIGVIGLDLSEDRFGKRLLRQSERCYSGLLQIAKARGRRIINLNPHTRLQAFPLGGWDEVRTK